MRDDTQTDRDSQHGSGSARLAEAATPPEQAETSHGREPGPTGPNFLYIGTSKAGSTWLSAVLSQHPDIFMEPGKGLYFFSDHYDRGTAWYLEHFRAAGGHAAVGELSHNYLYSEEAPARIAAMNPEMKLLVCLREPVERAFSDYLHRVKNGELDVSFEEAIERMPSLVEHGRYHRYLQRYVERFGSECIHVAVFDELSSKPDLFASRIFEFLKVGSWTVPPHLQKKLMPAGEPRVVAVAQTAKRVARLARTIGLRPWVGRAKRSPLVRNLLYREYTADERPKMLPETRDALRRSFATDVERLDQLLGTDFQRRWGY